MRENDNSHTAMIVLKAKNGRLEGCKRLMLRDCDRDSVSECLLQQATSVLCTMLRKVYQLAEESRFDDDPEILTCEALMRLTERRSTSVSTQAATRSAVVGLFAS